MRNCCQFGEGFLKLEQISWPKMPCSIIMTSLGCHLCPCINIWKPISLFVMIKVYFTCFRYWQGWSDTVLVWLIYQFKWHETYLGLYCFSLPITNFTSLWSFVVGVGIKGARQNFSLFFGKNCLWTTQWKWVLICKKPKYKILVLIMPEIISSVAHQFGHFKFWIPAGVVKKSK